MSAWQQVLNGDEPVGAEVDTEVEIAPSQNSRTRRMVAIAAILLAAGSLAWFGGAGKRPLRLKAGTELTAVTVLFEEQQGSATVKFTHGAVQHHYQLEAVSVYAKDAEIVEVGAEEERYKPGPIRTFRAREGGRWANARLHEDGTVSGLFEHEGRVLRVRPLRSLAMGDASHAVHPLSKSYLSSVIRGNSSAVSRRLYKLEIDKEDDTQLHAPEGHDWPHDEVPEFPEEGGNADVPKWAGERWFPGCYEGDMQLHTMSLGIIGDVKAYQTHGSGLKGHLEQAVHEASFIYEMQMNFRLVIGKLSIYKQESTAPLYARDCSTVPADDDPGYAVLMYKLDKLVEDQDVSYQAATHLFTSCVMAEATGSWSMTVGLAYTGTACLSSHNFGTNMVQEDDDTFLTFAHELGHNLAADHSFEDGQGSTGGLMDYGDGKLDGVYQFNTHYRKEEVCLHLDQSLNNCQDKFGVTEFEGSPGVPPTDGTDAPTATEPGTTAATTAAPTSTCKTYPGATPCVFPFVYDGLTFHTCTSMSHHTLWCATSTLPNGTLQTYGTCRCCDYQTEEGDKCEFPSSYYGVPMNSCVNIFHTHVWCYNQAGGWGNCAAC